MDKSVFITSAAAGFFDFKPAIPENVIFYRGEKIPTQEELIRLAYAKKTTGD